MQADQGMDNNSDRLYIKLKEDYKQMNSNTQDISLRNTNHANPDVNECVRETLPTDSHSRQLKLSSCNTGVDPVHSHGLGVWGNPRVVFSVRVDKKLKKRFTLVSKRVFGSTCNPVESFMASIVGSYDLNQNSGVYPSITIGEIKIERNLRERRKLDTQFEAEADKSAIVVKVKVEDPNVRRKDLFFNRVLEQWNLHSGCEWRGKMLKQAEPWKDKLESAKKICDLVILATSNPEVQGACDILNGES